MWRDTPQRSVHTAELLNHPVLEEVRLQDIEEMGNNELMEDKIHPETKDIILFYVNKNTYKLSVVLNTFFLIVK